ncbi:sedoheptulose 7-phosphate cyclase [Leptolyngbya cf. ectocarpi LEGE 11479]|uniref:Sedoheptulose 7-phosphate cyclase n=1 Tax=Leptolyngbya cf. ectocarpi LEGE 11479 TaxID=1828722 RepID=A0A928X0E4_LEPEC|nr:sedoheptulose 7-phosphate cyclase [Leptolyngbya ectocarpi]MBE9065630.1 sedoheptulose 7-phosphate cyclase [Leptolyngbya cf. ectocarpi LEGE 11479]
MSNTTPAVQAFISAYDSEPLAYQNLDNSIEAVCCGKSFRNVILALVNGPAFSEELGQEFAAADAIAGLSACRSLRSCLNFSTSRFFGLLAEVITAFDQAAGTEWTTFAARVHQSNLGASKLLERLLRSADSSFYQELADRLVDENPHAIYPTSSYRESQAHVVSTDDDQIIEAVMTSRTFTSIRVVENSLDPQQTVLRDMYIAHGRCVCLVDQNVETFYGEQIETYFKHHGIHLEKLVYRAMEVDKGIHTVERMLGDFKAVGVCRNEPVLIVGGGVLTDTGGLACALYHRNTPYVMLSTSIVAGIDAGPSPRTCCDGFGYKNLFGAYHAPVLSLTDRSFFKTLREGWLRHGIAEIIKMATVKNIELFEYLEQAGPQLIETRFGTLDCEPGADISVLSQKILGAALRSYVEAEYDNLYETHQCRPHAYGHTWSPGFEIEAGLLHGHAVAIGMGFGAYLSYRDSWITSEEFHRILRLISSFGLSLWNDVLLNQETLWASQEKIVQKRGGNLVAPLPKGTIGNCGYLNTLPQDELYAAIDAYRQICADYPRQGLGVDPLCSDVGLEDPSTVGHSLMETVKTHAIETVEVLSPV